MGIGPTMNLRTFLSLTLLGSLTLSGCKPPPETLRVGINVWPGYEPFCLAKELGYYKSLPIEIVTLPTTAETIRAYRNGVIDCVALTLDESFYAGEEKTGQRIILVCDYSAGADKVMARPEFKSMADLRGHRIGVEHNALGAFVLSRALDLAKMTVKDVTLVTVPLDEHDAAYLSNRVDAIVTFEPHCTHLKAMGAVSVFDSSQIPGEITDVLITNSEAVSRKKQAIRLLVDGWFRALDYQGEHPGEAAKLVCGHEGQTPDEYLQALQGMNLPTRKRNVVLLGSTPENLQPAQMRMQSVMLEHGLLTKSNKVRIDLDDEFVR